MSKGEDRIKKIDISEENLKSLRKSWFPAGSGPISAMATICGLIDAIAELKGYDVGKPKGSGMYLLQKDLLGCPAGRIFLPINNGLEITGYFHAMDDEDVIANKYTHYKFTKKEVESNPEWFKLVP